MTISKVIRGGVPDEEISRWKLPGVGAAQAEEEFELEPEPEAPRLTVEEIEALQKAAYEEAYARGHAEGLEAGRTEGLEQGLAEGRQQGEQEAQALAAQMREVLDALATPLEQLDAEVEEQLLQLSLTLAQQIIRRELQLQPGEVVAVVREAVGLLPLSSRDVRVYLHPEDARFLRETLGESEDGARWKMIEDPSLSRGGCRVATDASRIDATLERRLAVLARDLLGGNREDDGAEEEA